MKEPSFIEISWEREVLTLYQYKLERKKKEEISFFPPSQRTLSSLTFRPKLLLRFDWSLPQSFSISTLPANREKQQQIGKYEDASENPQIEFLLQST